MSLSNVTLEMQNHERLKYGKIFIAVQGRGSRGFPLNKIRRKMMTLWSNLWLVGPRQMKSAEPISNHLVRPPVRPS